MTSLILYVLLNAPFMGTLDFIDSKDDPAYTYLIINSECTVKIKKADRHNEDLIVRKALDVCGYSIFSLQ